MVKDFIIHGARAPNTIYKKKILMVTIFVIKNSVCEWR